MTEITVRKTTADDIPLLIALQRQIYPTIPPWNESKLREQLLMFPRGQMVAEGPDGLLGCASSIIVAWDDWAEPHSWKEITSSGTFENHNPVGRTLYGVEVFVDPESQGQGVGHLLYEARRTLCREMNLKRIICCGRLPGYHKHASEMTAEFYAKKVVWGDIKDPVLSFQIREGFSYCGVMEDYIPEDQESCGFASLIVWLNPDYRSDLPVNDTERDSR
jgi:GNAT superfamily N-acetyltransferase